MNTILSDLDVISLNEFIEKAYNHKLKFKPKIGLSKKIKFGIEIEALGTDFINIMKENKNVFFCNHNPVYKDKDIYGKNRWILYYEDTLFDDDGKSVKPDLDDLSKKWCKYKISDQEYENLKKTSYNGGEVASPILKDNVISWLNLKSMLNYMKKNISDLKVNESCSCHTHFDIGIFNENPDLLYNFIILLAENENVLSRFYSGEYINLRQITEIWAKPIKPYVRFSLDLDIDKSSYKDLIKSIYCGIPTMKQHSFDFWEIYFMYYDYLSSSFENRLPNATLSLSIIQNNVMLMGYLMEHVANGKYDVEKGIYNLKNMNDIYGIADPFYLADMLPNDEAKLDFLTQYYKDGNVTDSKKLIKSKRIFY